MPAMVHPSKFVETVIEMDKDFNPEWIEEMIVSRISPVNFDAIVAELTPHISACDPNGAKFAISTIKKWS